MAASAVPLTPVIMRLARRYPIAWPPAAKSLAVHALGHWCCCVSARHRLRRRDVPRSGRTSAHPVRQLSVARVARVAAYRGPRVGCHHRGRRGAGLRAASQEREVRDAELREQLARAELATLRARLHPHFLFNALHSIGALVRGGDNAAAVRVVAELSELLREAISRDAPDMVRLRDELAFVRRYLDIEAVRFADRLRVEWDLQPGVGDAVLPSLVVQPLVENAMRHAVAASWNAGRLRISARRDGRALAIDVSDDGPGMTAEWRGRCSPVGGIGWRRPRAGDTRACLTRLYGADCSLTLGAGTLGGATASLRVLFFFSVVVRGGQ